MLLLGIQHIWKLLEVVKIDMWEWMGLPKDCQFYLHMKKMEEWVLL